MTRRTLLQQGLSSLAASHLRSSVPAPHPSHSHPSAPVSIGSSLAKYVDALTIPSVLAPRGGETIEIELQQVSHQAHRDLPPSTVWGYNGTWPGPTIEVRRTEPIAVRWKNRLPSRHLLPIDTTIHGAESSLPAVRSVAHLHGAAVAPEDDGFPEAWFTADGKTGAKFRSDTSRYPNEQPSATLWYHDHCLGITRLNMYAGLAGFYLIRDDQESALHLPGGQFEIPLMLQDRQFESSGRLLYPRVVDGTHPVWIQEFFGDVNCVNGKVAPFLDVEPRKYRFRILNASNSRFYHLRLFESDAQGRTLDQRAEVPAFYQIGSDSGLLPAPVRLHYLLIAPGERFDVVVDFSSFRSQSFVLVNDAPAPYTMGGQYVPLEVLQFRVAKPLTSRDTSELPGQLVPFEPLDPSRAERERVLAVSEIERPSDGYVVIGLLGNARWHEPITEDPKAGTAEIWSFANTTGDVHPLHVHLVRFQVLNRQSFDVPTYLQTGKLIFTGRPMAPEANERPAWKDTIKCYPGYVTRVIQRFDLPSSMKVVPGAEYLYVWHCHILEHEDNEMMRPYKVIG